MFEAVIIAWLYFAGMVAFYGAMEMQVESVKSEWKKLVFLWLWPVIMLLGMCSAVLKYIKEKCRSADA